MSWIDRDEIRTAVPWPDSTLEVVPELVHNTVECCYPVYLPGQ